MPVYVDGAQMEQILLNLTVNSRDAIGSEGTITIRTSTAAPCDLVRGVTTDSAWLQVIDTGAGIPEDIAQAIFEPFFSTKPAETGTGLGLATVYGILSQSRGDIYVDCAVGVGTCMTVVLPAGGPSTPG